MIIIRISNGLGNQLFQYALGRSLSSIKDAEFALDLSSFAEEGKNDTKRNFLLDSFDIKYKVATKDDFIKSGIPYYPSDKSPLSLLRRTIFQKKNLQLPINKSKFITEPGFAYMPEINTVGTDCYISGVWQSEKYFSQISDQLRSDIKLKAWGKLANAYRKQITTSNTTTPVSIHIRRGDYVTNQKTFDKHGLLGDEYYRNAVQHICSLVTNPVFYIFSDDIEWCRDNLDFIKPAIFVSDKENLTVPEELALMSLCRHHIIANSTFSWWGAWLNPNTDKLVIAPKKWFNTIADTKDLIPSSWVQL